MVHHTGKSGEIRGSTALYGAADSVMALKNSDGMLSLSNSQDAGGKNKHAPEASAKYFKIVPHAAEGFEGAVIVEAEKVLIDHIENELTENQQIILDCIADYGDGVDAQTVLNTTNLKLSTVYRNLKNLTKQKYLLFEKGLYSLNNQQEF